VCAAAPAVARAPRATIARAPDPTAGLPADASELHAPRPREPRAARPSWAVVGVVAFAAGALCGVGGVLGVQALTRPAPPEPETAQKPPEVQPAPRPAPPPKPEMAPMPHELVPELLAFGPDVDDDPDVRVVPVRPPGMLTTYDFNKPTETFSVPVLKKGEHVVLRGKVKALRVHGLDAGALLDARDLETPTIIVTGKVDGRSTLRLRATNGAVNLSAKIDARSTVEIDAPGGDVRFTAQTTPTREGSKIDNGATVTITARTVEFKGEIGGADTKVSVTLTRNGQLKVGAVTGRAVVEYRSQVAGWAALDVTAASVAPTATFRRVD
jgi:hypothetical protein